MWVDDMMPRQWTKKRKLKKKFLFYHLSQSYDERAPPGLNFSTTFMRLKTSGALNGYDHRVKIEQRNNSKYFWNLPRHTKVHMYFGVPSK